MIDKHLLKATNFPIRVDKARFWPITIKISYTLTHILFGHILV